MRLSGYVKRPAEARAALALPGGIFWKSVDTGVYIDSVLFHLLVFCIDARWGAPKSDLSRKLYEMNMPVEAMCDRLDVLDPDGFCTSCSRHGQRPGVLPPECFKGFIRIIQKKYRTAYARGTSCQVLIRVLLARLVRTE